MPLTLPYLVLYTGMFVGAFLTFEGLRQVLWPGDSLEGARSRRLRMIRAGRSREEVFALLRTPDRRRGIAALPVIGPLARAMPQAGIAVNPLIVLGLAVAGAAAAFFLLSRQMAAPLAAGLAVGGCLALPGMALLAHAARRRQALAAQLPDALDMMARGLKVGHPLSTSIVAVSREMPDPIGTEFGLVADQVSYGDELVEAVRDLARRADMEDLHHFATSVAIQHGAGGNLARVLEVLSSVIRRRQALRRKIRALSSEGRLSSWILSALPPGIFAITTLLAPDFYGEVSDDPLYQPVLIVIGALTLANMLILNRLVNFRV